MAIDPTVPYDDDNIFAKILRGEIPNKTVYEDEWVLAFHDINPQAPEHILVIPKGRYVRAVGHVAREAGMVEPGYRLLANIGKHGHQEVAHLHVHIFAGKPLGPMLMRS
jgi:histidine triad (HIT) family protein